MESIFIRMTVFLIFGFILMGFGETADEKVILGGETDITPEDAEIVKKGKELILETMEKELVTLPNYKVSIKLSGVKVKKQVVAGTLYNYKYIAKIFYERLNSSVVEKPDVIQSCSASVWYKLDGTLEIPKNNEPKCEE